MSRVVPALLALALAVAGGAARASTPAHEATVGKAGLVRHGTVSGVFSAGGVSQFLRCTGSGAPTVVLVSGLGAGRAYWSSLIPLLGSSRVCRYDRPGIGSSPPRNTSVRVDAATHAYELAALLRAAGEAGPVVLVGHSYGGLVARAYALRYPSSVRAMLLLDAAYAGQGATDGYWWPEPRARIDMRANQRLLGSTRPALGARPLIVMTAGIGNTARWMAGQRAMSRLSRNAEHVIVPASDHVIHQDNPPAVARAVRDLVSAVRTGRPLGTCRAAHWSGVGTRCVS